MRRLKFLLFFALLSLSCSKTQQDKKKEDNIFYNQAFEYKEQGMQDSAFKYFIKAKDLFLKQNDSLGAGKCFLNMAIISEKKNDNFGSQEASLSAIKFFNEKNKDHQIYVQSNFNNLGLTSEHLADYTEALDYYQQSLRFTTGIKNTVTVKNNIANSYRNQKKYEQALTIYNEILNPTIGNTLFAKVLSNLAFTKWLQQPTYNAAPELMKALYLREKENDPDELNSSYNQLSSYYEARLPDSALIYANKMYEVAKKSNRPDDQLQALQKIIMLSPARNFKRFFEIYHKLDDSVEISRNIAKNQFASIRYETERHKAEVVQKQNDIIKRNILVGILVIALIFGYLLYRRRRKRLQQEKELEVKNTELKYVKKIHDRVANKVYNVMSEVENTPDMDKDHLLDKLDVIYHISRDISYERNEDHDQFASKLATTLKSYTSATVDITISGNDEELWLGVNDAAKSEVVCILQELMTNMKKHSRAENVDIRFERKNNRIDITYFDDGIGMKAVSPKNGLQNTETRIQSILGSITFDNTTEKGLKILISFPLT